MSDPWIAGIPPRAERAAARIDVLTPTYWRPVSGTILAPQVWTRWKHFHTESKRPYPCPSPGTCPACVAGLITYATGFLCCCSVQSNRPAILQLSDLALADLEIYCAHAPLSRGLQIKTTRQDTRSNAKMHAEILGRDAREYLPAAFDPRPTLERMWGLAEVRALVPEELHQGHRKPLAARRRERRK